MASEDRRMVNMHPDGEEDYGPYPEKVASFKILEWPKKACEGVPEEIASIASALEHRIPEGLWAISFRKVGVQRTAMLEALKACAGFRFISDPRAIGWLVVAGPGKEEGTLAVRGLTYGDFYGEVVSVSEAGRGILTREEVAQIEAVGSEDFLKSKAGLCTASLEAFSQRSRTWILPEDCQGFYADFAKAEMPRGVKVSSILGAMVLRNYGRWVMAHYTRQEVQDAVEKDALWEAFAEGGELDETLEDRCNCADGNLTALEAASLRALPMPIRLLDTLVIKGEKPDDNAFSAPGIHPFLRGLLDAVPEETWEGYKKDHEETSAFIRENWPKTWYERNKMKTFWKKVTEYITVVSGSCELRARDTSNSL